MDVFASELLSGGSGTSETVTTDGEHISYVTDIQDMMYGFGDSSKPLLESAQLIEEVIHHQMVSTYNRAVEVSEMRGSKVVRVEDVVFLLRNNKSKLQRILKFLALKEIKRNVTGSMENETVPEGDSRSAFGKCSSLINYLLSIDQTGEIEDIMYSAGFESAWTGRAGIRDGSTSKDESTAPLFSPLVQFDAVKYDRSLRADEMSQLMDKNTYFRFFEARKASFASFRNGGTARFWDWISNPRGKARSKKKRKTDKDLSGLFGNGDVSTGEEETPMKGGWPQPTTLALEVLSYLAFEGVAQLIDFALLVRRDGVQSQEDRLMPPLYFNPNFPIHQESISGRRYDSRYQPYPRRSYVGAVPRSSADSMVRSPKPITPAEIYEALRRYYSPCSIGPLSHFDREPAPSAARRLLCC
ncbi:transcription initiation protein SPT3 homolog [Ischnura elegans]|uniref:transcription initiation protein SPT3 homolog n=1 Tax=Ischnura elegans TaxID=197161 RepID=UPI001ED8A592|nr:transcription initiation protein SPT3 homolog [Ischnura elegans]XP_046384213.1 transcription initiation protein SPT3 homolog [Ischnura elegans]XP_046384214.1 transcription initiation protein SPT3 homolog [Ischnura elegans]XP_046384215.1 transcription initiation protein SPT3 homolog [Ischnura elegans]